MRNQQQISNAIQSLNFLGISYSKIGKDWNLPHRTISLLANKAVYEYQAEPQTLRKANDGLDEYIMYFQDQVIGDI